MERTAFDRCALAAAAAVALTALLPPGDVHAQSARGRTVTIVVGQPGDHWADTLRYTKIGQARRGDEYGYEVRLEAGDGCRVTLFFARRDIDLRGDAPGFRLRKMRVPTGWLWYPDRLTARSLPKVYPGVMELEAYHARQAEGAIAAARAFADVAAVGGLAPVSRAVGAASRPALRSGAARTAPRSGAARAAPGSGAARTAPGRAAGGGGGAGRLLWGSWKDYPKVTVAGREYAQIGGRLYTEHAVSRMLPRSMGGRGIAPAFVEEAIATGSATTQVVGGVTRTVHQSGTVQVVTEQGGRIVVTVNPFSGVP